MTDNATHRRIDWYRVPLDKETLQALNRRSDLKGLLQMLPFLGLLTATGGAAIYGAGRWPWPLVVLVVFLHGTFFAFLLNAFHELCHRTVFRSKFLNAFFLRLVSFISWHHHVVFTASHMRHHRYTLHPPDDSEVVLPIRYRLKDFLLQNVVTFGGLRWVLSTHLRYALGKVNNAWEETLFPANVPGSRRQLANWSRLTLSGHALILALSIWQGWWMLPVVTTFARFYGNWLMFLCNSTQHVGLQDNVADFRLCARTIHLNPILRFLYWHMNWHIEHHMYAGVPCYHLHRLHRLIEPQLPPTPRGLYATWKHIDELMQRQYREPGWQYQAPLPPQPV